VRYHPLGERAGGGRGWGDGRRDVALGEHLFNLTSIGAPLLRGYQRVGHALRPPRVPARGFSFVGQGPDRMPIRAAFYVDGFNVYHALDDLGQPHLKWLDWNALALRLIPSKTEELVKVTICTAIKPPHASDKAQRHRKYLNALKSTGVVCLQGDFAEEPRECRDCGATWKAPVEKQGDVNLAISIIDDAHRDVFDHCYLVTADSDQAATARLLKTAWPQKKLTTVVITGRSHCKALLAIADHKIVVSEASLEHSLFPSLITGPSAIRRPVEYDPPAGWVHPAARPK